MFTQNQAIIAWRQYEQLRQRLRRDYGPQVAGFVLGLARTWVDEGKYATLPLAQEAAAEMARHNYYGDFQLELPVEPEA